MSTLKVTDSHLGKFETYSGEIIELAKPDPSQIRTRDISRSLSHIVRFMGHISQPYTVAHHSIIMSYMVKPEYALEALMHDASEAYLGDVISPLKQILGEPYKALERAWDIAIALKYDLRMQDCKEHIKLYDTELLKIEHSYFRKGMGLEVFSNLIPGHVFHNLFPLSMQTSFVVFELRLFELLHLKRKSNEHKKLP